jgi:hypothetical protein
MYKVLKSEICGNFGPLIEHDPHWINFTILTSESNRYFKCLYKIWNKIISFDTKKRGNLKHVIGKVKKNMNLNALGMNP